MKRLAALLLGICLVGSGAVASPISAAEWTDGVCNTRSGVTVVIDFQELGAGTYIRCAPGPVHSGFDALQKAGIQYQTTVRFPGFLCRIAGQPSNDPCINASPASAFWSYWIASRGGAWCYSNLGAGNRTPPPGTVEGWSFSLNRTGSSPVPPGISPPPPLPGVTPERLGSNDCDQSTPTPKVTTTTSPAPAPTTQPAWPSQSNPPSHQSALPGTSHSAGGPNAPTGGADQSEGSRGMNGPDGVSPTDPSGSSVNGHQPQEAADGTPEPQVLGDPGVDSDDSSTLGDGSLEDELTSEDESANRVQAKRVDLSATTDSGSATGVLVAGVLVLIVISVPLVLRRRSSR